MSRGPTITWLTGVPTRRSGSRGRPKSGRGRCSRKRNRRRRWQCEKRSVRLHTVKGRTVLRSQVSRLDFVCRPNMFLHARLRTNSRQLPGVDALHPCRPHKTVSARARDCSEGNGDCDPPRAQSQASSIRLPTRRRRLRLNPLSTHRPRSRRPR